MEVHLLWMLLIVVALASYLNYRYLRLPPMIGLIVIALVLSGMVALAGHLGLVDVSATLKPLSEFDFSRVLLHGMLAYLLFAGALNVDLRQLRSEAWPVGMLATAGVFATAFIAGFLFWIIARYVGIELPYAYALVFGALIAPTDPIAVNGIMKQVNAPSGFRMRVAGESLFNDGIGVALFVAALSLATHSTQESLAAMSLYFVWEACGAVLVGFACGWIVYKLLATVDQYTVEIMLTLALAGGVYGLAEAIHVSAPIAVVVAAVVIGNFGRASAMSETTRLHLDTFWELIDEILNGMLFVLIGLEVLLLHLSAVGLREGLMAMGAIAAVLVARALGVVASASLLTRVLPRGRIVALTWAGMRGGISIALALSIPQSPYRYLIIICTYCVVVFSIVVQGLTLGPLLRALCSPRTGVERPRDEHPVPKF